ncbi:hypothetical protein THZG08_160100 [Vibrio owensii]|nr:hypothetical protein THZG08_160100 [Vibrio owensii]CAH1553690.1 hypothetical protein THOA03_160101 [Vibrio owensii]CAH1602931.1 hypothetical protein THF1C08_90052 [Vibrio jasicida]
MFLTSNPLQLPLVLTWFAQHLHFLSKGEGCPLVHYPISFQAFGVISTSIGYIKNLVLTRSDSSSPLLSMYFDRRS